jgi:hypothetical protein
LEMPAPSVHLLAMMVQKKPIPKVRLGQAEHSWELQLMDQLLALLVRKKPILVLKVRLGQAEH